MGDLTAPDWIHPGARVGVLGTYGGSEQVKVAVVKSVGKTYVVLENGDRYHLRGLSRRANAYGWHFTLHPLSGDKTWSAAVGRHNDRLLRTRADTAYRRFRDGKASVEDVIRALAQMSDHSAAILAALPEESP